MNPPGPDSAARRSVVERALRQVADGCSFAFLLIISLGLLVPALILLSFRSSLRHPPPRRAP